MSTETWADTYTGTQRHMHRDAHRDTHMCTDMHALTGIYAHAHTQACAETDRYILAQRHTAQTATHPEMNTNMCTYKHAQAHMCT
jgi:hypothetical protein